MGKATWIILGTLAVFVAFATLKINKPAPMPTLDPNPWWGPGKPQKDDTTIKPFSIKVSQKELEDLNKRLALKPRLTPALEGANFTYGMNEAQFTKILNHWINKYDWKKREANINKFNHFKTQIEGLDIHFIREKPKSTGGKKVVPLLILHGWPGSFVEFLEIIPLLTTPREGSDYVFEVVAPSLPGYGFSQGSSKMGLSTLEISQIMKKLMGRLGHQKFFVQGGDWGSVIATSTAMLFPDNVLGVHVNMAAINTPISSLKLWIGAYLPPGWLVKESLHKLMYPLGEFYSNLMREMGYMHLQATKPDTVGVALNSSPIGLAAYILEKFSTWTNSDYYNLPDGGFDTNPISLDRILDNIHVYWFSGSITTSMRLYSESFNYRILGLNLDAVPVTVPAGFAIFPKELVVSPQSFLSERFRDIVLYSEMASGGHFGAMEAPALLAAELHNFVKIVLNNEAKPN